MLLTGTPISASEAAEHGLVNRVVAPEQLNEEVMALARQISSASAYTVAIGKQAFYRQRDMDLPAAYEMAQRVMVKTCWPTTPKRASPLSWKSARPSGPPRTSNKTGNCHSESL